MDKQLLETIDTVRRELSKQWGSRAYSPTWVMYEVMNVVRDEDLKGWGLSLAEIAEAIEKHLEEAIY